MSVEKPFKLSLLIALSDSMKQITVANGYHHDLKDVVEADGVTIPRVFRGRTWFGDTDPLPMLSMLEGVNPVEEVAEPPIVQPTAEYDWPITLQGWTIDDPLNPTDTGHLLLADVRRRLAYEVERKMPGDPTTRDILGMRSAGWVRNRVEALRFGSGVVRPADEVSNKTWFWLTVIPRIVDNPKFPFD